MRAHHRMQHGRPLINPFPAARSVADEQLNAHHNPMQPWRRPGRPAPYQPKAPKRIPRAIPDERFNELFAALASHRDRALLTFWISTGARAQELLTVVRGRADAAHQLIGVVRKGSRALQVLPASSDAFVWLRLYQNDLADQVRLIQTIHCGGPCGVRIGRCPMTPRGSPWCIWPALCVVCSGETWDNTTRGSPRCTWTLTSPSHGRSGSGKSEIRTDARRRPGARPQSATDRPSVLSRYRQVGRRGSVPVGGVDGTRRRAGRVGVAYRGGVAAAATATLIYACRDRRSATRRMVSLTPDESRGSVHGSPAAILP